MHCRTCKRKLTDKERQYLSGICLRCHTTEECWTGCHQCTPVWEALLDPNLEISPAKLELVANQDIVKQRDDLLAMCKALEELARVERNAYKDTLRKLEGGKFRPLRSEKAFQEIITKAKEVIAEAEKTGE